MSDTAERAARALLGDPGRPSVATGRPRPAVGSWFGMPEPTGILRPRLLAQLNGALDVRLATVVAPAGAGKTTLLAQWAHRVPVDVAWYRADSGDTGADAVLGRIGDAIRAVSANGPPARDLDGLLVALDRRDSPLVLVIDDLHLVAAPDVGDLLLQLLLRMPARVHLVVGSRTAPPLNLARTELPSLALGVADLRFRSPETDRLFRTTYVAPLAASDAQRLTRHTQGWAAGLHLFHRSVADLSPDERHQAVLGLSGRVRYAREYLAREVLGDLPDDLVRLLRRTSVLESLTERRCDRLLGSGNSQRALLELERSGVLTACARGRSSFRLHSPLRAHLATELRDELGDAANEAWLGRAARVTEEDPGDDGPAETVRLHAAAGDWRNVLELLDRRGPEVLGTADLDWLDAAPRDLRRREVWLRLAEASRAVRDGRLAAAAELASIPEGTAASAAAARLSDALLRFTRLWTTGDLEPGRAWFEQLRADLRRPAFGRAPVGGTPQHALLGAIELAVRGDVCGARQRLEGCLESLHDDRVATLTGQLVAELLTPGDSIRAAALADRAECLGMPWFARMAHGLAAAVDAGPDDSLAPQIRDAENRGDPWGAALLSGIECVAALAAGRPDPVSFDDLVSRCRALDSPVLEAWARAGLALAAAGGQLPDAVREGRSAEGYARCAEVPGALAVSYGALAVSQPEDARELLALADMQADAAGLGCRPWTWVRSEQPPSRPPRARVTDAPPLGVRCFGRFALRVGDEAPALTRVRPRARALLRVLALQAGLPVHREILIDALWPDFDQAAGTHNLHVCVSSLRSLLEPGTPRGASRLLVREGDRYTLRLPAGSDCDLQTFDVLTAQADRSRSDGDLPGAIDQLEEAVGLYTGEVLPEDGPAEWVIGPRERYRLRAAEAAALLAELFLGSRQPDRAAAAALRSIDIDPCRDGSWRVLVAAYEAAGDLAAAERSRRSYAEVLVSLGVVSERGRAIVPRPRFPAS